jgi:hypothetical protein
MLSLYYRGRVSVEGHAVRLCRHQSALIYSTECWTYSWSNGTRAPRNSPHYHIFKLVIKWRCYLSRETWVTLLNHKRMTQLFAVLKNIYDWWAYFTTLKIEAMRSSEWSQKFYRTTWYHTPEGSIFPFLPILKIFKGWYLNPKTLKIFKNNIFKPAFLIRIRYCINRQRQDQKCVCWNIRSKRVNRRLRSIKHTSKLCRQ